MVSIAQSDFKSLKTEHGIHDAYVLCAIWCIAGVIAWKAAYAPDKKVAYFFERGARLEARANAVMKWGQEQPEADKSYFSHAFIKKRDARAIQAADLLAWEWQKELNNKFGQPKRPRRLSFRSLLQKPHLCTAIFHENTRLD